jgi:hypothetical protein
VIARKGDDSGPLYGPARFPLTPERTLAVPFRRSPGSPPPRRRWRRLLALTAPLLAFATLAAVVQATSSSAAEPAVYGDIRVKYDQLGGAGFLGRPITEEQFTSDNVGRIQTFEYGMVVWHPTIGAFALWGDILQTWLARGGIDFGYPITDELGTPDGVGRYNHFRHIGADETSIYWTPATGAQPVWGDFRAQWAAQGWERSSFGYPVTAEFEPEFATGMVRQNFQNGWMEYVFGVGTFFRQAPAAVRTERMDHVRCRYRDSVNPSYSDQYFREFLTAAGRGKGNFVQYVEDQTYGRTTVDATITPWYTMDISLADAQELIRVHGHDARGMQYDACRNAATRGGYTPSAGASVIVHVNEAIDGWGSPGARTAFLDSLGLFPGFAFHELLHGMGLDHSWSSTPMRTNEAVYGDWFDQMSARNTASYPTKYFGEGPVGLNAFNREQLGAFTADDIRTVRPTSGSSTEVQIEALEAPQTTVRQVLKVQAGGRLFSVEYRNDTGFTQGIDGNTALIHEIRDGRSYLMRNDTDGWHLADVQDGNVSISVVRTSGTTATIRVQG